MPEYYMPQSKKELVQWIKQRYWVRGQTATGLEKKEKRQLIAIYFELIRQHRERSLHESTSRL